MIDPAAFSQVCGTYPALGQLPDKLQELLRDELDPGEAVELGAAAQVGGVPGGIVLTERRLIAVWTMKLFFFFKFPAVQEFAREQIRKVEEREGGLYVFASADSENADEDYEENLFQLDPEGRSALLQALR